MTLKELIERRFKERQHRILEDLAGGGAQDFAHYRYLVGYLRGMYDFHEEIGNYLKNIEEEDDE